MKREPGRLRVKLAELLSDDVILVLPEDVYPAKGAYRTNKMLDNYVWEAFGRSRGGGSGMVWSFQSYDTMSECVKHGITFIPITGSSFDVNAKSQRKV